MYCIHTFEHKYKNANVCIYYIHIITHRAAKVRPVDPDEGRSEDRVVAEVGRLKLMQNVFPKRHVSVSMLAIVSAHIVQRTNTVMLKQVLLLRRPGAVLCCKEILISQVFVDMFNTTNIDTLLEDDFDNFIPDFGCLNVSFW